MNLGRILKMKNMQESFKKEKSKQLNESREISNSRDKAEAHKDNQQIKGHLTKEVTTEITESMSFRLTITNSQSLTQMTWKMLLDNRNNCRMATIILQLKNKARIAMVSERTITTNRIKEYLLYFVDVACQLSLRNNSSNSKCNKIKGSNST
jgi:hypothetical protein